jgi:pyruvate kinase
MAQEKIKQNRHPRHVLDARRARIVCTLGPVTTSPDMVEKLMRAGMDAARLNFSHGSPEEHTARVVAVRRASGILSQPVAIIADLQGPKIRTGSLPGHVPVLLEPGNRFTITTRNLPGTGELVSTSFQSLPRAVKAGGRILLSDGEIELQVRSVRGKDVICEVVIGGLLNEHQGINLPGANLDVPAFTPKDRRDLALALKLEVNYVAISFVRRAADVREVKAAIRRAGKDTPVIAKLERPEALDYLDEILAVADGVMVARGDLGVELSPEKVPVAQKHIIARARDFRVPVITATQMLDSMKKNPRPTRAEASDVANAIFDGSDAVMLSGETAIGRYPLEAVRMMGRIILEAEKSVVFPPQPIRMTDMRVNETVAELVCHAADELRMKAIAVFTESGSSARLVSKYRPRVPIVAFSPDYETRRRISLFWGVLPRTIAAVRNIDSLAKLAERRLLEERYVRRGDIIGIVAGTPIGVRGTTNFMKLHVIGSGN